MAMFGRLASAPAPTTRVGVIMRTAVAIALAALLAAPPAAAEGRLEGRYEIKLAGVTIGKAAILLDVFRDEYTAAGSAKLTGILRAFRKAHGTVAAHGKIVDGQPAPLTYSMTAETNKRPDEVRIAMVGRRVREFSAEPPVTTAPDRVPITDAHRRGVLDPLSAALMFVSGTGDVVRKEACERTLPVFDGRYRYEIELRFHSIENVSAKGYDGPAVICTASYRPIAGHRPSRTAARYSAPNDEIRVWLVPIAGTRALVPYRVTIGTTLGTLRVQAVVFNTATTAAKSQ
jgi:hypothetical protein